MNKYGDTHYPVSNAGYYSTGNDYMMSTANTIEYMIGDSWTVMRMSPVMKSLTFQTQFTLPVMSS